MNGFKLFIDGRTLDGEFLDGTFMDAQPEVVPMQPEEITIPLRSGSWIALVLMIAPPRLTRERAPVRRLLVRRLGP